MEVKLGQGTQEWLDYRRSKFNASETPILYGRGFTSPQNLAYEKLGIQPSYLSILESKANPTKRKIKILTAVKKGQVTEGTIREHINKAYDMSFRPMVLLDDDDSRFSASLDGYDENNEIVLEIKTSANIYLKLLKYKTIPKEYIYQCYHQLMVSKAPKLLFVAGFIDGNFDLKIASSVLLPNQSIFDDIRAKWNAFEAKYLKAF